MKTKINLNAPGSLSLRTTIPIALEWPNPFDPFGDANAAGRIVNALTKFIWGTYRGL